MQSSDDYIFSLPLSTFTSYAYACMHACIYNEDSHLPINILETLNLFQFSACTAVFHPLKLLLHFLS